MKFPFQRLAVIGLVYLASSTASLAAFQPVWTIGAQDGRSDEFGSETFVPETVPGSPTARDDFYYTAGTYPDPIGPVVQEPFSNFERALTSGDPRIHVYAVPPTNLATLQTRYRLTVHFIWSGSATARETLHDIVFRINGWGFITNRNFQGDAVISAEVDGTAFAVSPGQPVIVQIERIGGTPDSWLGIDYLQLEADPIANVDNDQDGAPRNWELQNGFRDDDPNDVLGDFDQDGIPTITERLRGTHPKKADTDSDGLLDGEETLSSPLLADTDGDGLNDFEEVRHPSMPTNPGLADSDSDGSPDPWELHVGTDPNDSQSRPAPIRSVIGLHFVSGHPEVGRQVVEPDQLAGVIPQVRWNSTINLIPWGVGGSQPMRAGNNLDIKRPVEGTIIDVNGSETSVSVAFEHNGCWTTANSGSANQRLLNGYLLARSADPARLTLSNIPFTNYHAFIYVASDFVGATGAVRINLDMNTDFTLRPFAVAPQRGFFRGTPATPSRTYLGNYVCYTNLTSASLTVDVLRVSQNAGLCAVQLVDAFADFDNDGLPDWFELKHKFNPGAAGDGGRDDDLDGLTNAQEFARGTNPRSADSDGDGLADSVETGTGTFVSANDTGSSPVRADSDGDGLSDGVEVNGRFASNPNLTDTDSDGANDRAEALARSAPDDASIGRQPVPTINPTNGSLLWEIRHVQIRWNHDKPWETDAGNTQRLIEFVVENAQEPSYAALTMGLWARHGAMGPYFRLDNTGGFARVSFPGNDVWFADWNGTHELRSLMGFSDRGAYDFSDPLAFRIAATPGPTGNGDWTLSLSVSNEATGMLVTNYTEGAISAAPSILSRTATWRSSNFEIDGESDVNLGVGVTLYRHATPLTDLPAFAAHRDSDNDGQPDAWETSHGLNPNSAADALTDIEPDGLSNLAEYQHRTNPRVADTDSDGTSDGDEVARFSDPNDSNSRPVVLARTVSISGDVNGNGFPDAWESLYRASRLHPNGDEDGDGHSNLQEALLGTDPRSGLVVFSGRLIPLPNQQVELRFPNLAYKSFRLFSGSDLSSWSPINTPPTVQGGEIVCTLPAPDPHTFYYGTVNDVDSDADGVRDWAEALLGFDLNSANSMGRPMLRDSTGDGIGNTTVSGDYAAFVSRFGAVGAFSGPDSGNAQVSEVAAARLLMQASFGPTRRSVARVRQLGIAGWIDDQINQQPLTRHRAYIDEIFRDFNGPRTDLSYSFNEMSDFVNGENVQTSFARAAIGGPDQLRQRVVFALSQILVISRQDGNLVNRPRGLASYYDIFVENAFGNYYDILRQVTFHPCMGRYLSHLGNQPPAPEINRFPDENYAREVMQLFTIGLWELNPDGARRLDNGGQPIPTYGNEEITHLARVMTGFWYGGNPWSSGGWQDEDFAIPMAMHADYHDFGEKVLLRGTVIPSRIPSHENALRDVEDALRMLFEHPNTPAFISKALIQFLVTDNPSTDYVRRVHDVFVDNGSGVRGDLGAVVRAILLDPEARDPEYAEMTPSFGRMREPVHRAMHFARLTKFNEQENLRWDDPDFVEDAFQAPLMAPTVFNFFRPDYRPPGVLKDNGLVGPVFEITTSYSALSFPNLLWELSNEGFTRWRRYDLRPDYRDELRLVGDVEALVDHVNLLCCANGMSRGTRQIIRDALTNINEPETRARMAIYLALMAPEGTVQR